MPTETTLAISEFKARCLRLVEQVEAGETFVLTKRGKPIARVVPIEPVSTKGLWAGMGSSTDNIVEFDSSEDWEALG